MAEPRLEWVTGSFTICSACLDGEGGECHTAGCVMWLNRAPDLPLRANLLMHDCRIEDMEARASVSGAPDDERIRVERKGSWLGGAAAAYRDTGIDGEEAMRRAEELRRRHLGLIKDALARSAPGVSAGGEAGEDLVCAMDGLTAEEHDGPTDGDEHGPWRPRRAPRSEEGKP